MEESYTMSEIREAFMTFGENLPDPSIDEEAPQEFSHRQIWVLFSHRLKQVKLENKSQRK